MMHGLATEAAEDKAIMIDATYLKAHRLAFSPGLKKGAWAPERPHQRRHEHEASCRVADAQGRPICMFTPAGPVSDDAGAAGMPSSLPQAE